MSFKINHVYNKYFPAHGPAPEDWRPFGTYKAARTDLDHPDFSISETKTWKTTAKIIAINLLKIILFPWALYEITKSLLGRIALLAVLPAQILHTNKKIYAQRAKIEELKPIWQDNGFVIREIILDKNGHRYSGIMLGHKAHLSNGKWALFAPGNATTIEETLISPLTDPFVQSGFNLLLINAPGVGKSQGLATVDRIADAQEVGLSFLETAIKAKKIVLSGHSLGGAAIGLAALKHTFKPDINYLAIRLMTFDKLSHVVKATLGTLASLTLRLLGCEMDSLASSTKLQQLGIHELIIQGGQDQLMAKASLLDALESQQLMENKTGHLVPHADHCDLPASYLASELIKWDRRHRPRPRPLILFHENPHCLIQKLWQLRMQLHIVFIKRGICPQGPPQIKVLIHTHRVNHER